MTVKYPADMDVECIKICDALNNLSGIETTSSCCGHGERPFMVFFNAAEVQDLRPILESVHSSAWRVEAGWANGSNSIYFMLLGPKGGFTELGGADDLATAIAR